MRLLLISLLLLAGCISPSKIVRHSPEPPLRQFTPIDFEELDTDSNGDISKKEIKQFNEKSSAGINSPETYAPIWTTVGIITLTMIMCGLAAIFKCKRSE